MVFKKMKIKSKMLVYFTAGIMCLMTVVMLVTTSITKKAISNNLEQSHQVFGHIAANVVVPGLAFDESEEVAVALSEFTRQELFAYIRVEDKEGEEVFYYQKEGLTNLQQMGRRSLSEIEDVIFKEVPVMASGKQIGTLLMGISLEELNKTIASTRLAIGVLSLLMIGVFVLIILSIANIISKPILEITNVSQKIAEGNLTHDITIERDDEIGVLAKAFSTMVGGLRELVAQVKAGSNQISVASDALSKSSQQMSVNSENTERQMSAVSTASELTNRNVQTVATAAEEMATTLKEISKNIQEESRITMQAVRLAESTNSTISKLDQSSIEIGEVIKVITSIAQQTNLLALNATIEAARAGEAGKGFAVVANEVKELAKGTAKATNEISQKISAIQADTHGAISAIGEISKVITQINEISTTVAAAVEEQAFTTADITQNMAEAARGTSEVVQSISAVTTASKNTAEGANNILESSRSLSKMGEDLMLIVKRFHIDSNGHGSQKRKF